MHFPPGVAASVETPALLISLPIVAQQMLRTRRAIEGCGTSLYYSVKSLAIQPVIRTISSATHGFAVSSLFEARLVRESVEGTNALQYYCPFLLPSEIDEVVELCERISLNSYGQCQRFGQILSTKSEVGIRINPGMSFATDERFDPCRRNSKLGVPLEQFKNVLHSRDRNLKHISGIHFHSNCEADNPLQLSDTMRRIEFSLGDELRRFRWLNVGGGYDFHDESNMSRLVEDFARFRKKYGLDIVIEPGASIVRSAGFFVSTVQDIVAGDDYPIAILDLTVNHWPEIFEYQFEPDLQGHVDGGHFSYMLAGCSCLAGDVFGEYSFHEPLEIGSRLVFPNAGAYSIVKANMFNGINLPNIYAVNKTGDLTLVKKFTYEDFLSRNGVDVNAYIGT